MMNASLLQAVVDFLLRLMKTRQVDEAIVLYNQFLDKYYSGCQLEKKGYPSRNMYVITFDEIEEYQIVSKKEIEDFSKQKEFNESKQAFESTIKRLEPKEIIYNNEWSFAEGYISIAQLQRLQEQFSRATGLASLITNENGIPITVPSNFSHLCKNVIRQTEKGRLNCFHSDAIFGRQNLEGPVVMPCLSCGLWDAGVSINIGNRHVANWLIGQVRTPSQKLEDLSSYAEEIGADKEEFMRALKEIPVMSEDQFRAIAEMLFTFAGELSRSSHLIFQKTQMIEQLKKAEKEIIEQKSKYKNLADSGLALIWTSDTEKQCIYFNQPWLQFTGKTLEQEYGTGWSKGVHPDDFEQCLNIYAKSFDERKPFQMEYRLKHHSGDYRWILDIGTPSYNSEGVFIGYIGHCFDISERKESELIHKKLFSIIDKSPYEVYIFDAQTLLIEYANELAIQNTGYSQKELLDMAPYHLKPEFDEKSFREKIEPLLTDKTQDIFIETNHRRKSGNEYPVKVRLMKDNSADPPSIIAMVADISHRINVEKQVQKREEEFKAIFDNNAAAVVILEKDTKISMVNDAFCAISGYSKEEVIGSHWSDLLPEEERNRLLNFNKQRFEKKGEAPNDYKFNFYHKDGSLKHALISVSLIKSSNKIVASFIDVTARREIERAVKKAENHFRSLIENASDGVVLLNHQGQFTFISPPAIKMFGYSQQDVLDNNPSYYTHPDDLPMVLNHLTQVLSTPEYIPTLEYRFRMKNGEYKWIESVIQNQLSNPDIEAIVINFRDISERRKIMNFLKESEEKFKNLAESSPFAIMIFQKQKWVYSNPAGEKISGFTVEELKDMNFWDFIHPEDLIPVKERGLLRENGEKIEGSYEFRIITKEKLLKWVYLTGTNIIYNSMPAALISVNDITERKKTEVALQDSRRLFENIANISPVGIFRTNAQGETIYVNPKWMELSGLSFEEGRGFLWRNSVHPEDQNKLINNWGNHVKDEKVSLAEFRFVRKDGTIVWVMGNAVPEMENGKLIGYIGTITDISARKMAEEQIRQNEQRYRSLFSGMLEGFAIHEIIVDENKNPIDYKFLEINPAFEKLTGLDADHVIGKTIKEIMPEIEPLWIKNYGKVALLGESLIFENQSEVLGKIFRVVAFSPQKGQFATLFEDITERKQLEKLMLDREREEKVRVEKELEKTKEALIRSTRLAAVGQVSATIAHDLRNPLGAVRNAAYFIKRKKSAMDESLKRFYEIIDEELENADTIITNLLMLARVKDPHFAFEPIEHLISQTLNQNYSNLNVKLEIQLSEDAKNLYCDAKMMIQVFRNLFENSVQAGDGKSKILVSSEKRSSFIYLQIMDDGPGISETVSSTLFEPLITSKAKGTGLGLTISKQIIEKHHGQINVCRSSLGGAGFEIILPDK